MLSDEDLIVKIIDVHDQNFCERDFLNELQVLKDIRDAGLKGFPTLKDWGVTD